MSKYLFVLQPPKMQIIHASQIDPLVHLTLDISKSKGPSESLSDTRTLTYRICRIEENTKGTTKFHK